MLLRTLSSTVFVVLALVAGSACQTARYYTQAIGGQWQIVSKKQPIPEVIRDAPADSPLPKRLTLVQEIVTFADSELDLPADRQYQSYLDLGRPYVVWNVQAAPEFSLEAKTWWYPIVGSLEYRGYFKKELAVEQGDRLKCEGYDVHVGGVAAYSTLGWFNDPVLNTFIDLDDADLAELLIHELAHRRLFLSGDTDFNEAFATAVGREGARRWLLATRGGAAPKRYLEESERDDQVIARILRSRDELERLYAGAKADRTATEQTRLRKVEIVAELRSDYQWMKRRWPGYDSFDRFMAAPINNARLNGVDTYFELVPKFERMLASCGGDLNAFFEKVETGERMDKEQRRAFLETSAGVAR